MKVITHFKNVIFIDEKELTSVSKIILVIVSIIIIAGLYLLASYKLYKVREMDVAAKLILILVGIPSVFLTGTFIIGEIEKRE